MGSKIAISKNRQLSSAAYSRSRCKRARPEDALQRAVVDLLARYEAQGHLRFLAIPNGGKRSKITGAILKRLGVRRGVPDILCVMRDGSCVWLELKAPKGTLSSEQQDWLGWLKNTARHGTSVIRDANEVPFALGFARRSA
jgi:hypothetical protein